MTPPTPRSARPLEPSCATNPGPRCLVSLRASAAPHSEPTEQVSRSGLNHLLNEGETASFQTALMLTSLPSRAKHVGYVLAMLANLAGHPVRGCQVPMRILVHYTGLGPTTVRRGLRELEAVGVIDVVACAQVTEGESLPSLYRLHVAALDGLLPDLPDDDDGRTMRELVGSFDASLLDPPSFV